MHRNLIETVTGFLVILLAIASLVFMYKETGLFDLHDRGYILKAEFEKADGLTIGSEVKVSGIKIGQVVSQSLNPTNYYAVVTMRIHSDIKLPSDTSAEITGMGFLGERYISLSPGSDSQYLGNGDVVDFTQSGMTLESVIGKAIFGAGNRTEPPKEPERGDEEQESSQEIYPGEVSSTVDVLG